jgi:ribosome biogenesis GTPase / thiamine phosphate phosphatase
LQSDFLSARFVRKAELSPLFAGALAPMELRVNEIDSLRDSTLCAWGYGPFFSDSFAEISQPDWVPARVVANAGTRLQLAGAQATHARLSGKLRHETPPQELPTVGDWVAVSEEPGGIATIHRLLPRRTKLVRRAAGTADREQIVAANVDVFFIVTSANRDANPRRLERYLAAVFESGAQPIVVINKIDLVTPAELCDEILRLAAHAVGVPVVGVSAHTGDGVRELASLVAPTRTFALIGSSGVGKSSLVNQLLDSERQAVLAIDENDRGRHATTHRELFALPDGRLAIDTPGMRSFGLLEAESGLEEAFSDIERFAESCRFRDCKHQGEPGCSVIAAIETGDLELDRLASAQKLERELEAIERRRDPAALREHKARWRSVHMAQRARKKVDPKLQR